MQSRESAGKTPEQSVSIHIRLEHIVRRNPQQLKNRSTTETIMEIKFPITVNSIKFSGVPAYEPHASFKRDVCGRWVAIRPCAEECKGKTFLGVLLGSIAISTICEQEPDGGLLVSPCLHNPAIFVPDLNRVVFGYESWWGEIKNESDLRQITDADIEGVWYVRMLKEISAEKTGEKHV